MIARLAALEDAAVRRAGELAPGDVRAIVVGRALDRGAMFFVALGAADKARFAETTRMPDVRALARTLTSTAKAEHAALPANARKLVEAAAK